MAESTSRSVMPVGAHGHDRVRFNNARPRLLHPDTPPKHVIEEYRHPVQQVTCVCGWEGSSASTMGMPSPWTQHVRASKGGAR